MNISLWPQPNIICTQLVPSNINTLYPLFVWRKLVGIVGPLISFSFFWCHIAVFDSIAKVLHMIFELNPFSKQIGLTIPVDPLTTEWHIRVWAILGGPWEQEWRTNGYFWSAGFCFATYTGKYRSDRGEIRIY